MPVSIVSATANIGSPRTVSMSMTTPTHSVCHGPVRTDTVAPRRTFLSMARLRGIAVALYLYPRKTSMARREARRKVEFVLWHAMQLAQG